MPLFMFFEPKVEGLSLQVTGIGRIASTSVLFSLVLALSPIPVFLIWKKVEIVSAGKRAASIFIILAFVAIAVAIRHQSVKAYLTSIVKNELVRNSSNPMAYPINPLNFVYYIIAGFCIGSITAYFLLRKKKN